MRALYLNADYSFLNLTTSFNLFVHSLEGKAIILKNYEGKFFRSQYLKIPRPSVGISTTYVQTKKRKRGVAASTANILKRDNFICGYCGCKLTFLNGTKDHVIPISKGGKSSFLNLTAACKDCNNLKADKTLSEANMRLLIQPREISNEEKLEILIKSVTKTERKNFLDFLRREQS